MIYVFDLDDTLYEEITYVKSGYRAVATFIANSFAFDQNELFHEMELILNKSRNKVFDQLLKNHKLFSKQLVKKCVSVYRHHKPVLKLYPDAKAFLEKNKAKHMYLVTDGNKLVQKNKINALRLTRYFKKMYLTNNYGHSRTKPSPYCFLKICEAEEIEPNEVTYIADNPYKDFIGIKPLGFHTIRIARGNYQKVVLSKPYEANAIINEYKELEVGEHE